MGEDWSQLLDRLVLELTLTMSRDLQEGLSPSDQLSLLVALNKHPLLHKHYTAMDSQGSLFQGQVKTDWLSL